MPGDRPLRIRDLLDADEDSVRWAVRELDRADLVAVLSVEDDMVVDRLCAAMGRRSAELLREEIEFGGAELATALHDAESRVDAVLRRLVRNGRLTLLLPAIEDDILLDEAEIDDLLEDLLDDPTLS